PTLFLSLTLNCARLYGPTRFGQWPLSPSSKVSGGDYAQNLHQRRRAFHLRYASSFYKFLISFYFFFPCTDQK
ncbi:hypothetical protein MIMGU_mgv1a0037622mg, partial [Erythranthe guttata]